jgi:hypothetical protein
LKLTEQKDPKMKSHLKATFAAITIATLSGCAAPLPKGSDTSKYLPTPVDVSKMKPVEMTLKAKNGDEYDALRFHDVANNKWFDSDGYPVNEKFLRVRKDGFVCEVTYVGLIDKMPDFKTQQTKKPTLLLVLKTLMFKKLKKEYLRLVASVLCWAAQLSQHQQQQALLAAQR